MATVPEAAADVAVAVPVAVMAVTDAVAAVEDVRIPAPADVMDARGAAADVPVVAGVVPGAPGVPAVVEIVAVPAMDHVPVTVKIQMLLPGTSES